MNDKIKIFLETYILHIIIILFFLVYVNDCSVKSTNKKLVSQNKELILINNELKSELDSLEKTIPNQELLLLYYNRQMYKFLTFSLLDWNNVVRTKERPDDIIQKYWQEMNKISDEIDIIERKLNIEKIK